ncbi:MAG: flagellar protein FlgN [Clostridiales bacterium]|nr:flagellar protein FlgN [Clostridiales bacterium]
MSNYSQGDFDSLCKLMHETINLFDEIISLEGKKLNAISEDDVALFDQLMNDEQAYLLQMKGLDFKREKLQGLLGADGLSFKQIIDRFEAPERETLDSLYADLASKTSSLKSAISSTKRHIDLHLSSISALLEKLEGAATYDKNGGKEQKAPPARFTPTKA